jgi:pilus assembly protein FimV
MRHVDMRRSLAAIITALTLTAGAVAFAQSGGGGGAGGAGGGGAAGAAGGTGAGGTGSAATSGTDGTSGTTGAGTFSSGTSGTGIGGAAGSSGRNAPTGPVIPGQSFSVPPITGTPGTSGGTTTNVPGTGSTGAATPGTGASPALPPPAGVGSSGRPTTTGRGNAAGSTALPECPPGSAASGTPRIINDPAVAAGQNAPGC